MAANNNITGVRMIVIMMMVGRVIYIHHHLTLVACCTGTVGLCVKSGKNEAALDRDDIIYCDISTTLYI